MSPEQQGSQVISRSVRSWGRSSGANTSAVKEPRSFRGQKILKPGHPGCTFFQKKLTTFLVIALKTQTASAADCFTVKIKQIKHKAFRYSNILIFCSHYYTRRSKAIGSAEPEPGWWSSSQVISQGWRLHLMTCLTTLLTWKWPGCLEVLAPLLFEKRSLFARKLWPGCRYFTQNYSAVLRGLVAPPAKCFLRPAAS